MAGANANSIDRLLLDPATRVTCPKCDHEFSLEEGFAKKALEQLEDASRGALAGLEQQVRSEAARRAETISAERDKVRGREIDELKKLLEDQGKRHQESLQQVISTERQTAALQAAELQKSLQDRDSQLAAVRQREAAIDNRERNLEARVATEAKARATELFATERQSMERQLSERSAEVRALKEQEFELREEREKLKEEKESLGIEIRRQVDAQMQQRESTVRTQEMEKAKLREADLQQTIEGMKGTIEELQRKSRQGSQQLQGEVLELAIEAGLGRSFPLDTIEEVKKGVRGGDVIQRVTTRTGQAAGVILWETKRAKDWSPQWIGKLKEDMRRDGADLGVLVTMAGAIPTEWDSGQLFGLHQDVWVTTWSTAIGLAEVLREGLVDVHKQRLISAGKGEKMEAVYDYLTSPQFAQKLKAVYGTFQALQDDLQKERAAAEQRWARREKQIAIGRKELLGFAGDVQGLAQQELPQLELEPPLPALAEPAEAARGQEKNRE